MSRRATSTWSAVDDEGWSRLLDDVLARSGTLASDLIAVLTGGDGTGRGGAWGAGELAESWEETVTPADAI